jgi:hypothetical protein
METLTNTREGNFSIHIIDLHSLLSLLNVPTVQKIVRAFFTDRSFCAVPGMWFVFVVNVVVQSSNKFQEETVIRLHKIRM